MPRYTLYCGESATLADATEQVRAVGARVIKARPGLALIEATQQAVRLLRGNLPEWQITQETKARVPILRPKLPPAVKR